jgi:adenine-specific DNA-methyltransferase
MSKHELGQYFTTNQQLQEKVISFILNEPIEILEPSIGRGDLVSCIQNKLPNVVVNMYEIDKSIVLLENIARKEIIYGDFMKQNIDKSYRTIVGNPPYVKTKQGNLYIDFTEKCYHLLEENGELIFIVPSDFFKLTSAVKLLNEMMIHGTFTHVYHPHKENLFANASIDVIIYRYCKNKDLEKKTLYNDKLLYIINHDGLITFSDTLCEDQTTFKDYFDVYVGIVSGKEDVYKNNQLGNINVLNGKNKIEKYVYITEFPSNKQDINHYLLEHKTDLLSRKIKKFNENNWFEWGAPRNISVMENNAGEDCVYISNLTRNKEVAFVDKVQYFGGSLIMLKPKKKCNLYNIVNYLNSEKFKENFMFSNRFKIGHRQICNSVLPNSFIK